MFRGILKEMDPLAGVRRRFAALEKVLDEKTRRLVVAAESKALGRAVFRQYRK